MEFGIRNTKYMYLTDAGDLLVQKVGDAKIKIDANYGNGDSILYLKNSSDNDNEWTLKRESNGKFAIRNDSTTSLRLATSGDATFYGNVEINGTGILTIDSGTSVNLYLDRSAANKHSSAVFQTAGSTNWAMGLTDSDVSGLAGTEFYIGQTANGTSNALKIDTSNNATFAGKIIADAGIDVDNFNIDGTTISLSSGDQMTLDSAGRIDLSADDNGEIRLYDGSLMYAVISEDSNRLKIKSVIQDADLIIAGNDGGSEISALTFDMSTGGDATFRGKIQFDCDEIGNGDSKGLVIRNYNASQIWGIRIGRSGINNVDFSIYDETDDATRMYIDGSGSTTFAGNVTVTGNLGSGALTPSSITRDAGLAITSVDQGSNITVNGVAFSILDGDGNVHWNIFSSTSDIFEIHSVAYGGSVLTIDATGGGVNIPTNLDVGAGIDVTGNATFAGDVRVAGDITGGNPTTGAYFINNASATASTPNYSFYNDTSTGMYRIGANNLGFTTAGTIRINIASDAAALTMTSDNATFAADVTAFSDIRLKNNINTIDSALDKVMKMRGVTFERIDSGKTGAGVLADELEKIAPELVHDGEYKSVAYGNLTSYLIEAIKELKSEVEVLRGNA